MSLRRGLASPRETSSYKQAFKVPASSIYYLHYMLKNAGNRESKLNSTDPALNPYGSHLKPKNFNNLRRRLEGKKSRRGRMLEVDSHGLITQSMGVEHKSPLKESKLQLETNTPDHANGYRP